MILKYIFDRVVSFIGLLFLSPILLLVAVLIKLNMPKGPVLFKQQRVGRKGKLFTLYKFRTMNVNHDGGPISVAGESRITSLGAKLRKWKLDELLELWNVLIGDMSFVGSRPDVPGYADQLKNGDERILELRPGITGPASMKYRDEEELLAKVENPEEYNDYVIYPDKTRLNLYYLTHYSFVVDIKMIVYTVLGKRLKYNGEMI